ncbi:MAG: hypothetical protein K2K58_02330, partial [Muribaculaceae bacterium]|nr:hypothetical protein [Muribaculaceae bacterium]
PENLDNDDQRMYCRLLLLEFADKTYHSPKDDKEIKEIMNYFIDGNRAPQLHPEIYYYAGRTYAELNKDALALSFFDKALHTLKPGEDISLQNRIHAQKGNLYNIHHLYSHGIKEFKQHVILTDSIYSEKNNRVHLKERIGARLALAVVYIPAKQSDKAWEIYKELEKPVAFLNDPIITTTFHSQLAQAYLYKGNYRQADSIATLEPTHVNNASKPSVISIQNKLKRVSSDSTFDEISTSSLLDNSDFETRYQAALTMFDIAKQRQDAEMMLKYAILAHDTEEKIQRKYNENSLAEMENILTHTELEKENLKLSLEGQTKTIWIIVLSAVCIMIVTVCIIIFFRHRMRKLRFDLYLQKLKEENYKRTLELESQIEALNTVYEEEIKKLMAEKEMLENKEKESFLKNDLKLSKITAFFLSQLSSPNGSINKEDLENLQRILTLVYPDFMSRISELNLSSKDLTDAMLIKIKIPQKLCASYFNVSPSSLANMRKRLFNKYCKETSCSTWKEFILHL